MEEDAVAAEEILRYALYKEVVKASKSDAKRRKLNKPRRGDKGSGDESSDDDDAESSDDEDDGRGPKRMAMPAKGTRANPARGAPSSPAAFSVDGEEDFMLVEAGQDADADDDEEAAMREAELDDRLPSPPLPAVAQAAQVEKAPTPDAAQGVDPARAKLFQTRLAAVRKSDAFKDSEELTLDEILQPLNAGLEIANLFGRGEVEELLTVLANQADAVITYDGGVVYF
ncbi:MCM DNA helicase complex subunit [Rhodotorula kratochvilovae]